LRLLVLGQARMTSYPLPRAGEVSIGRDPACDVRVDEPGIAARHALLRTGPRMALTDCATGAATVVGSRRLDPGEACPVAPGVVMQLGTVTVVVQASGASTRLRHVRSHDYFEGRLEDECARAEANRGAFAVLRIKFLRNQAQPLEEAFTRHLRPVDLVAVYAADEYELLLVDTTPDKATLIAGWLAEHVRATGAGELKTGLACWPLDGRSPEVLLAAAGAALHGHSESSLSRVPSTGALASLAPLVERVAATNINVLILGETGVGKEVLARRIHERSPRASFPMLCVNCASLTETLLESELFGHERGAFTGAHQVKPGLLEVAEGGTVLLDEIGEMPLTIQAKVLRVVEQRSVTRVGGLKARSIDVRFMAATHRNLEAEIGRGRFREDLYYRLNGVSLVVPPLRERTDEIAALAESFLAQFAAQGGRPTPRLTSGALEALQAYSWPGNVRELRNMMERAVMLGGSDVIDLSHLPHERLGRTLAHERISEPPPPGRELTARGYRPGAYSFAPGSNGKPPTDIVSDDDNDDERTRIIRALERCAGNQTHAARMLGISRRTLISRIERYALPRPRKREDAQ
jgi:DNA-binding NtrC family response regulator